MKKIFFAICMAFICIIAFTACGRIQKTNDINKASQNNVTQNQTLSDKKIESSEDINSIVDTLYKNLYIGETFTSGFAYIEPFSTKRMDLEGEPVNISNYPNSAKIFCIDNNISYDSSIDSKFSTYVPEVEKDSIYFHQSFSKPTQYGLRYKLNILPKNQSKVIALLNYEILSGDLSVKDEKRTYSTEEYNNALSEIKKDKDTRDPSSTLSNIELDSTIVAAKKIGVFSIKNSDIKILLSIYYTHSYENAAIVYVVDFIKDNKVIKTYQKYNWYGV